MRAADLNQTDFRYILSALRVVREMAKVGQDPQRGAIAIGMGNAAEKVKRLLAHAEHLNAHHKLHPPSVCPRCGYAQRDGE